MFDQLTPEDALWEAGKTHLRNQAVPSRLRAVRIAWHAEHTHRPKTP
jgi:hypothetical protein